MGMRTGAAGADRDPEGGRRRNRSRNLLRAARRTRRNDPAAAGVKISLATGPAFGAIRPFSITCLAIARIVRRDRRHVAESLPRLRLHPVPAPLAGPRAPLAFAQCQLLSRRGRAEDPSGAGLRLASRDHGLMTVVEPHSFH